MTPDIPPFNANALPSRMVAPVVKVMLVLGSTTEHTEHTEKEGLLFRVFGVFRGCLHPPVLWFSVTRASM
jgi:hypothetical protein